MPGQDCRTRVPGRRDAVAVGAGQSDARPRSGRAALGETWRALRGVFAKPSLRRMQLALAASLVGDWAYSTAVTVWAYREGGTQLVGLWAGVRLALIAVATPLGASVVDRLSRKAVMLVSTLVRAVLVTGAVVALVARRPHVGRARARDPDAPRRLRLPPRAARLAAVPDVAPRRADRRQRRVEHHRQPGLPHRAGDRRARRRDDQRRGDVRGDRGDLPGLGGARGPDPPRGRRPDGRPAEPRPDGRLQR